MTTLETAAWLVLLFPLAGTMVCALGWRAWPGRTRRAGSAPPRSCAPSSPPSSSWSSCRRSTHEHRQVVVSALGLRQHRRRRRARSSILVDPLSVLMILVVTGVSTLIHLYSVAYMWERPRLRALLRVPELLRLLDAPARPGGELLHPDHRVGVRRRGLLPADLVLVPPPDGDRRGHQGVRHQRRRRRRARARHVLPAAPHGHGGLPQDLRASPRRRSARTGTATSRRGCCCSSSACFAKSAQIPLHTWLPDAMEGPTPVSALIHAATMVTAGVYLIARLHPLFELSSAAATVGMVIGAVTLLVAGTIGLVVSDLKRVIAYSTMSQIGYMIMAVSAGAYVAGHVPPHDARLLQGAAVHGGRLDHRGDGGRAEPRPHGRLPQGAAVHLRLLRHRRPRALRHPAVLGLLLQGRDPARHRRARAACAGSSTRPATSAPSSPRSTRGG